MENDLKRGRKRFWAYCCHECLTIYGNRFGQSKRALDLWRSVSHANRSYVFRHVNIHERKDGSHVLEIMLGPTSFVRGRQLADHCSTLATSFQEKSFVWATVTKQTQWLEKILLKIILMPKANVIRYFLDEMPGTDSMKSNSISDHKVQFQHLPDFSRYLIAARVVMINLSILDAIWLCGLS